MIPSLDPATGYLPYSSDVPMATTLNDVASAFATNARRKRLWDAFSWWLEALDEVGFPGSIRLGGSFITGKNEPGDLDVAVAVPSHAVSEASAMLRANPHFWTWQQVGTLRPGQSGWAWTFLTDRLQPALGMVDAHYFAVGTASAAGYARDWTNEHDDAGHPTGVRKAWLGVER